MSGSLSEIIAIETSVTDYLYAESSAKRKIQIEFFRYLRPQNPPRLGDNITIPLEEWEAKLLAFGRKQKWAVNSDHTRGQQVADILAKLFGAPCAVGAGGSLANTFDTLVHATLDDVSLTNGTFVTSVGVGEAGDVFLQSLEGKLVSSEPRGRQMEAHIFPLQGDRIIVTLPSAEDPASAYMSPSQLDGVTVGPDTKLIMLGGYMDYTKHYRGFLECILQEVVKVSSTPSERPTIVLTAGSQIIASNENLSHGITDASLVAPILVSANTGEFRRLLNMDKDWRQRFEVNWWINGQGQFLVDREDMGIDPNSESGAASLRALGWRKAEGLELENLKRDNPHYQEAKLEANEAAYVQAYSIFCDVEHPKATFVVTNGKHGVHVIDGQGISPVYLPPAPPHGIVNTVGGGDGFLAGYLLGYLHDLSREDCARLGFICAGEIIGQDEARLRPRLQTVSQNEQGLVLGGLLGYLDFTNKSEYELYKRLEDAVLLKDLAHPSHAPFSRAREMPRGPR